MAGNLCPGERDAIWLLSKRPEATEDDICDFIERVGLILGDHDDDEETAREAALGFLQTQWGES
jgi:hypothetical protein